MNTNQVGGFILFDFKVASKAAVFKMVGMVLTYSKTYRSMELNRKSRNRPTEVPFLDFFDKGLQDNPVGKRKSFQQMVLHQLGKHGNEF